MSRKNNSLIDQNNLEKCTVQQQGYQQFDEMQKETKNQDLYVKPNIMSDDIPKTNLFDQDKVSSNQNIANSPSLSDSSRSKFTLKVFILVTLQLLLTTIIGLITYNSKTFGELVINPAVYILSSIGLITISIIASCCTETFRKYGLPLFILFTCFASFLVSMSISLYDPKTILIAFLATFTLSFSLTIYAWKTKSDLTGCGPYLFVLLICLIFFGIAAIFIQQLSLVYSCLCVIIFGIYLVYDVQLVIGRGQFAFTLDDAFLAAINIYLDIINMFLHLLKIIGQNR